MGAFVQVNVSELDALFENDFTGPKVKARKQLGGIRKPNLRCNHHNVFSQENGEALINFAGHLEMGIRGRPMLYTEGDDGFCLIQGPLHGEKAQQVVILQSWHLAPIQDARQADGSIVVFSPKGSGSGATPCISVSPGNSAN